MLLMLIALTVFLATLFVVIPLWSKQSAENDSEIDQSHENIRYYKQELESIEQKAISGEIESATAEAIKQELKQNLVLEEQQSIAGADKSQSNTSWLAIGGAVTILLVVSILGGYRWTQSVEMEAWKFLNTSNPSHPTFQMDGKKHVAALQNKQRFARSNDINSLMITARTAFAIEDYSASAEAYEKVFAHHPDDVFVISQYVEVLFLKNNGMLNEKAKQLADKGLELDPKQPKIRNLLAVDAFKNERFVEAIQHWRMIVNNYSKDSRDYKQIMDWMANAYVKAGRPDLSELESQTKIASTQISMNVSLDESIVSRISPNLTVFIFAKEANGGRVPLAAKRISVGSLPTTITLTENDAMMASRTLAQFDSVKVGARVSMSGKPIANSGDWQVESPPIDLSEKRQATVDLVIAEQIP